jgi:hypothetical protein
MSVFDQVYEASIESEIQDLTEDVQLTRELLRFANLQIRSKAKTLEDLARVLFRDSVPVEFLRSITRDDRTSMLMGMGMLATLQPVFFP